MDPRPGLEQRVAKLAKGLALVRLLHKQDIKNLEKARRLQATEYERRLRDLNGEASRLREMQASYLPRETWENAKKDYDEKLSALAAYKDNATGRQALLAILVPSVVSLLMSVVFFLLSRGR